MRKCRIGTAKFFTLLLLLYHTLVKSDVYNQASDFYGGQTVYKDIVDFASKVPAYDCGAYYSDIRSALTDAITNSGSHHVAAVLDFGTAAQQSCYQG